ncbi:MAG: cellobiose phosphorylase [Candidatus Omnitrophica bacterium]|nr:cellobiose phosphorylase [Candidatus Omnitrophota bacterium]
MLYEFIDNQGTFKVKNPQGHNLYFPLTNRDGSLLSSISPNLAGDIKADNDHFITPPLSLVDIKTNLLCRRDFFIKISSPNIKTKNKILRLSSPWKDTLEAGFLYHKVIKESSQLKAEVLNFIPYNLGVEITWIKLINTGNTALEITPTSFMPLYGRDANCLRDHRHVSSLLNRVDLTKHGILLKPTMVFDETGHKANDATYFSLGFQDNARAPLGQFPSLNYFCGQGDLIKPDAIEKTVKPITKNQKEFDGKETIAALLFDKKILKKSSEVNYFLITGMVRASKGKAKLAINNIFSKLNTPAKIEKSLSDTKQYWLKNLKTIDFDFANKDLNNWLLWVKLQPTLRKLFGNSFLPHFDYGKGGRGWRDLSQDALALLLSEPDKAKKIIINNFKGVRLDGSNATIITKKGEFLSDRNSIPRVWMDHGIWPYLSLRLYINQTADLNILNKDITYFKDHVLKRAKEVDQNFKQKDFLLRDKSNRIYKGTVLEHILIQHLVSFFNVGKHNIIRLENADWNDGLDMAPDLGESVAFSFMYARNLKDLACLLKQLKQKQKKIILLKEISFLLDLIKNPINYNDFKNKQQRLKDFFEKTKNIDGKKISLEIDAVIKDLENKSDHLLSWLKKKEWLKNGFFNGYYDNKGKRVEGKINKKIRIALPSQVFALMNKGLDSYQLKKTWSSINKYLKDPKLGGFRLNSDFGSIYLDLGRAFGFSYGDKENGAFFNHMVIMLSYALYGQELSQEGSIALESIYKMATTKEARIYPGIPEYFNSQGKGLYLYLTGSASWYIYTLFEKVLGIKLTIGDIRFKPLLNAGNFFKDRIKVSFSLGNKKLTICYQRISKNKILKIKKLLVAGKKITPKNNSYLIKRNSLSKNTRITVYLG